MHTINKVATVGWQLKEWVAGIMLFALLGIATSMWLGYTPIQADDTTKAQANDICHRLYNLPAGDLQVTHEISGDHFYYPCGDSGNQVPLRQP